MEISMQKYEKPVWALMHDMADEFDLEKGDRFTKKDAVKWFKEHYPEIASSTVSAHLIRLSTNAPSRVHYNAKPDQDDLFYQIDGSTFRLYDPADDPKPIYEHGETEEETLAEKVAVLVKDYQEETEKQLLKAQDRIQELEDEVNSLRNKLETSGQIYHEIGDPTLRSRMKKLGSAPSDTIIREAGVILEDRLRITSGVRGNLHGVRLIDTIFDPEDGMLIFSDHPGEQHGVRMLYRGAMQFIRNPPMHKLMEYSELSSKLFLRMIDSLLLLLTELEPGRRDK
jgi:hypothetical protein